MTNFTIIGGNISGLSSAIHLAELGHDVTVYEKKIWRKPCGGGVSVAFYDHLKDIYGLKGLDGFASGLITHTMQDKLTSKPRLQIDDKVLITLDRQQLQEMLLKYAEHMGIHIEYRAITEHDTDLFTPQTIIATGIQKVGLNLLQSTITQDRFFTKAYTQLIPNTDVHMYNREHAYICINIPDLRGYAWIFPGSQWCDIGFGGMKPFSTPRTNFEYYAHCVHDHDHLWYDTRQAEKMGWGIPVTTQTPHHNYYSKRLLNNNMYEFFAVGDLAGMVTLLAAGGIETGWLSGSVLAESIQHGKIDPKRYAKLLRKSIAYQKPRILSHDLLYRYLYLSSLGAKMSLRVISLMKTRLLESFTSKTVRFECQLNNIL